MTKVIIKVWYTKIFPKGKREGERKELNTLINKSNLSGMHYIHVTVRYFAY